MSKKWLNNEFKELYIDENSKIAKKCEDLWIKTQALANFDTLQKEINKETFDEFQRVQENELGVKIIDGVMYKSSIKNDEYIKFLKEKIIPILSVIKFELDKTLKYFIIIDSFIHLAKKFKDCKQPSPEYVNNCILSQPLFHEYWNLLVQKITMNLYSLFDPNNCIHKTDANFHSLFNEIKGCNIQNIKINIQLKNKKVDVDLKLINFKEYIEIVKSIIIDDFFKNELHDYVCKNLKHFTTKNVNNYFTINDLFYIFTFAVKHLYWEIVEKLFCLSSEWKLSDEIIKQLFGENSNNHLFSWTVYCNLDEELNKINDVWKNGNYFKLIQHSSDFWGIVNAVDKNQHNIQLIKPIAEKYRFDANDSINDSVFKQKAIDTLIQIIKDGEVLNNIEYCHSLIEYLSKNVKAN